MNTLSGKSHGRMRKYYYSCTAHFSTIIVPNGKKQARKCPFYRLLRAFENYSNSSLSSCYVVFFVGFDGRHQRVLSDFYLLRGFLGDCIVILLSEHSPQHLLFFFYFISFLKKSISCTLLYQYTWYRDLFSSFFNFCNKFVQKRNSLING